MASYGKLIDVRVRMADGSQVDSSRGSVGRVLSVPLSRKEAIDE